MEPWSMPCSVCGLKLQHPLVCDNDCGRAYCSETCADEDECHECGSDDDECHEPAGVEFEDYLARHGLKVLAGRDPGLEAMLFERCARQWSRTAPPAVADGAVPHVRPADIRKENLEAGDMIVVRRDPEREGVHAGLYVGDGKVVDLWGNDDDDGPARASERPLADFLTPNAGLVVVDFHDDDAFPKDVSVALARAMAGHFEERPQLAWNGSAANRQNIVAWFRTGRRATGPGWPLRARDVPLTQYWK